MCCLPPADIRHVAWDGYIEVRGDRYSVSETWCGKPVSIRITLDDELRIYGDEQLKAARYTGVDTVGITSRDA